MSLDEYGIATLSASQWLADEEFFVKRSRITADISFLGYPMNLCDDQWILPIARHAIIASIPEIDFSYKDISFKKIVLVSGLSFEGGSGSPVFSSLRGTRINCDIGAAESDDYCPQKLLGIMSGHLQLPTEEKLIGREAAFTKHTGLSYFTKSSALLEIIKLQEL